MNRTVLAIVVLIIVIAVGGYFYFAQQGEEATTAGGGTSGETAGAAVTEAVQAAIDFCTGKGGTIEVVNAAEGTTHLCVTADGAKAEVK